MRILRLSMFNIRKNKYESSVILFLAMVTTLMLSIFVANNSKVDKIFGECFERSGSVRNLIMINENKYHDAFREILEECDTTKLEEGRMLFAISTDTRTPGGDVIGYNFFFTTEKTERKIESFVKGESLSEEEIKNIEHPVWLPTSFQIVNNYQVGDVISIMRGGEEYPLTVVGFFETGMHCSSGNGYKAIITEEDFELFSMRFSSSKNRLCRILAFNVNGEFQIEDYIEKCETEAGENIKSIIQYWSYEEELSNETQILKLFLMIIAFMSLVTLISAGCMIWNKISNDIEDQMQQIGVLEALGYRSSEISGSYLGEFLIVGGIGSLLGGALALFITPAINSGMEKLLGRRIHGNTGIGMILMVAIAVLICVIGFALLKARTVKNFPPVVALRKGIKSHHFGKNFFPLEKTKENVNVRLAFKGAAAEIRSGIGIAICIITAGLAILFSSQVAYFFKDGSAGLVGSMGVDVDTETIHLMSGVDPYRIREEILELPEVRKALISYNSIPVAINGSDQYKGDVLVYSDYADVESYAPYEGRFPEHDNEVMISIRRAREDGLAVGDSMVLEYNGVEKKYVVSGIVGTLYNGGTVLYMTEEGYRRINLDARPNAITVYLEDGVDPEAFENKVESIYGSAAGDTSGNVLETGSLEEKIRAVADEKIAVLLSQYGATDVDYAVQVGDRIITGNSRGYVLKEITSYRNLVKSQLDPIASTTKGLTIFGALLVTFVVGVIFWIIAASNVKRQRLRLGIMKGLGYSSKDLMLQMTLRTLPVTVVGVGIAAILATKVNEIFWKTSFSLIVSSKIWLVIVEGLALIAFSFVATYLGTGKIKKISVTELMTE